MNVTHWLFLGGAVLLSWAGTGWMRRYALRRAVLDMPNPRSSHSTPTPRGGGVAIAGVVLLGTAVGVVAGWVPVTVARALLPAGVLLAGLGWLDDRRGLPAALRFAAQLAAAGWIVWHLGAVERLDLGAVTVSLGSAAVPLSILGLVWLANLFNFMDGIDGIAAGEALAVGVIGGVLAWRAGEGPLAWLLFLAAAAALGFLPWNWSPARIFMGDAGSVFLGMLFGALGIRAASSGAVPAPAWALLLGVFLYDATVTLVRRILRGERWLAPHNSHAYQRAVQAGASHAAVSGAVLLVNCGLGALVWWAVEAPGTAPRAYGLGVAGLTALYLAVERRRPR